MTSLEAHDTHTYSNIWRMLVGELKQLIDSCSPWNHNAACVLWKQKVSSYTNGNKWPQALFLAFVFCLNHSVPSWCCRWAKQRLNSIQCKHTRNWRVFCRRPPRSLSGFSCLIYFPSSPASRRPLILTQRFAGIGVQVRRRASGGKEEGRRRAAGGLS